MMFLLKCAVCLSIVFALILARGGAGTFAGNTRTPTIWRKVTSAAASRMPAVCRDDAMACIKVATTLGALAAAGAKAPEGNKAMVHRGPDRRSGAERLTRAP